ncbi:hypothetical protein Emed_006162 [Eimeria media]
MEDVSTSQEAQPEEDVANNLQEGSSDSSEDEEAASSVDDSSESYIEPGVVKAMRRLANHRTSLTPLAVLASALVLALVVRRQMHPVEKTPPRLPGMFQEELVEDAEKPKVELIGPPEVGGVLEETSKKPMEAPPEKSPGVSQEELVEDADMPKLELVGPPEVGGVLEETSKKLMPVEAPVPVQTKSRFHEYEKFEVQKLLEDLVQWAKEAPVRKDRSLDKDELWNSRLKVAWRIDGVKYELLAYFETVTPAYNAKGIAAELAKGVPQLLEATHPYEDHARDGESVRFLFFEFGDPKSGAGRVSINSEFFPSLCLAIAPPCA